METVKAAQIAKAAEDMNPAFGGKLLSEVKNHSNPPEAMAVKNSQQQKFPSRSSLSSVVAVRLMADK